MSNQEQDNETAPFHKEGGAVIFDKPKSDEEIARQRRENEQHEFSRSQVKTNKRLAWFTGALVFASFCTIAVGIWQASIYGSQLTAMQGQLDEMKRSGEQSTQQMWRAIDGIRWMAQSSDWAQKDTHHSIQTSERQSNAALSVSIQSLRLSERPYVTIENMRFDPPIAEKQGASVMKWDFHNAGRTPALEAKYTNDVFVDGVKIPETPSDFPKQTLIAADRSTVDQVTITWAPEVQEGVVAGNHRLELRGTITYTDLFKEHHISTFCAAYRVKPNPAWVYCPGNDVK